MWKVVESVSLVQVDVIHGEKAVGDGIASAREHGSFSFSS